MPHDARDARCASAEAGSAHRIPTSFSGAGTVISGPAGAPANALPLAPRSSAAPPFRTRPTSTHTTPGVRPGIRPATARPRLFRAVPGEAGFGGSAEGWLSPLRCVSQFTLGITRGLARGLPLRTPRGPPDGGGSPLLGFVPSPLCARSGQSARGEHRVHDGTPKPAGRAASDVHRLSRGTADLMDAVLDSVEYGPILVPAAIRPAPRPTLGQRDPPA